MRVTTKKIIQGQLDFSVHDDSRIEQALNQIQWTHRNDDGWITVSIKPTGEQESWSQYHLRMDELSEKLIRFLGVDNVYISQNSFYIPKRTIFTIRKLNCLYVDLDYHHISYLRHLKPEEIATMLEENVYNHQIPYPSFVMCTGEGMALVWLIAPVPVKVLPLWQACENWLIENLLEYGADPSACDAARVLRLAGTTNSGNGSQARIIKVYDIKNEYTLRQIQQYLPPLQPFKRKSHKINSTDHKISRLFNLYSLNWARTEDLRTLQALRADAGQKFGGMREIMCFLFRYWMACFTSNPVQSMDETLKFNEKFLVPLSENEVKNATKSSEKGWKDWLKNFDENGNLVRRTGQKLKGYNYRNSTIIKLLQITPDEQRHMKTIISRKEKQRRDTEKSRAKRRNSDGLTSRQAAKQRNIQEAARMIAEGIKPKEIAKSLNCSTRYVYSLLKNVN